MSNTATPIADKTVEDRKLPNVDMGKTRITDNIRVSSAAIYYDGCWFGNYYQLETWIFSDDPTQKSRQVIHGTCGDHIPEKLIAKTKKVHGFIANNLKTKFAETLIQ